jgi:serpin B
MKKNLFFGLVAMALSSLMLSCSSSEDEVSFGETKTIVNMLSESEPINLTPEQQVFAYDNNQFALNFLNTVNETDLSGKSFIYSPLSITYVLGMVNDAATGLTEKELEETLGFHEGGIQAVNDYCKKLIDGLPKVDDKVTLNIANAIFLNKDWTLKQQFTQDMQTYYDAKAEALDFKAPETLDHINGWCNEKTNGMIPTILDEIDPLIMSYLLNAIYFKADWASKFDPQNTKDETFTTENGNSSTKIPMMHQNVLINYMKNNTYSAIEMPYGNGLWNMVVMMPEKGMTTDDIINHLKMFGVYPMLYDDIDGSLDTWVFGPYEVDLKLPRYETSSDTDDLEDGLIGLMKKMGIKRAFDDALAEIPNMCELPVYIEMMRQKAKIKVNEEGSEAAAVTVAGVTNKSMGSEPKEYPKATFHANRPFVYVIREASSGVILFVGKFTGA